MSFKTTYILFGLLVGTLLIFAITLIGYDESARDRSAYLFPDLHDKASPVPQEAIDQVVIERTDPAEKIVLVRDPETKRWSVTEPQRLRADRTVVNDLIRQVFNARRDEKFDAPGDLKSLGLDPPKATVTLKKGDEREIVLDVGDVTPGESTAVVYVRTPQRGNEPAAVRKNDLDAVLKKLPDFRERDLLSSSESDIQSVKLVTEGKKNAVALKKTGEGQWSYTEPPYGPADVDGDGGSPTARDKPPSGVRDLLRDLSNLRVEYKDPLDNDFVADGVTDFARYHLDPAKGDVLRVEIQRKEEGDKSSTVALLVGVGKKADGAGDKYYARREGEDSVVKVAASAIDPLRKLVDDPGALRDRTLVNFGGFKTPDAITVKQGSSTLEFRREESTKPWQMYPGGGETAQQADDSAVQGLVSLLTQKNLIKSFPELNAKESDLGLDKPAAVVSLWVDGIARDEKKDDKKEEKKEEKKDEKKSAKPKLKEPDKPMVRLAFGQTFTDKQGNKLVNVKREAGGETVLARVPVHVLERVQDGPLAYLDKSLPHFNEGADATKDVVKLTLVRGGVTTEVSREKEGEPWKFAKPAELAGRTADASAVEDVLRTLNSLRATKLVAEKAKDDAELDKEYGLKTPQVRAVVTVKRDGKEQAYEFAFGKELADKTTRFAKQGERDLIFTVDKVALGSLEKADLIDPVVLKLDADKVKAVKLTGWKNLGGVTTTLEFERKDGSQWAAKAPAGFNLDSGKVRTLVDDLANLRAEKFVTRDARLKAAYDAKVKDGKHVLTVELTVEGEKEPVKLTVANLDVAGDKEDEKLGADRGYYATASRLPGEVFLLRKGIFEGPMSRPAYFSP